MNRNSSGFKALFTFRNWILDVKSTFLMHSNSLNVSLVSLCDSFDALTAFVLFKQSIGEGKRGNELICGMASGMACWMTLLCGMQYKQNDSKKYIKLKIASCFGANQFTSSRFYNVAGSVNNDNNQKARKDSLISHGRLAFIAQHQIYSACLC